MTIWEAYERYEIMPNLRLHQMRVAAVARTVAEASDADQDAVTTAGLLHDMGNILKADLGQFPPEFYGEKGIDYWQRVKEETRRFGSDEHEATRTIVRELGVGGMPADIIEQMGFSKAVAILSSGSLELKIVEYADQRVAPYGITSMQERLDEGKKRYEGRTTSDYNSTDLEAYTRNRLALVALEDELFAGISIMPDSITEVSLKDTIEWLRNYEITGADVRD